MKTGTVYHRRIIPSSNGTVFCPQKICKTTLWKMRFTSYVTSLQKQSRIKMGNFLAEPHIFGSDTTMTEDHTSPENVDSRVFVQSILGQRVVCTLSDGRTAMGRLMCVDRLYVVIVLSSEDDFLQFVLCVLTFSLFQKEFDSRRLHLWTTNLFHGLYAAVGIRCRAGLSKGPAPLATSHGTGNAFGGGALVWSRRLWCGVAPGDGTHRMIGNRWFIYVKNGWYTVINGGGRCYGYNPRNGVSTRYFTITNIFCFIRCCDLMLLGWERLLSYLLLLGLLMRL